MIVESYEDVIVLSGALRSNFWETVHTAISLMLRRHPTGVIIDCSGITECTPEGADTFRDVMEFIRSHDARIIVASVPGHVLEVLKSVPEVRSQLAMAPSVEAARRSLDLLVEPEGKKRRAPVLYQAEMKVLVGLLGHGGDQEALRVASQIGDTVHAEINVVYVVLVPRDLPIQSPLPEREEAAAKSIEAAKNMLAERQLPHKAHLERARDVASAVNAVLQGVDASYVVLALSPDEQMADENARLVKSVLAKVKPAVVFTRAAL
ncbi:MAG TPA: hypothetical protein VM328_03175 [Fimbriimonadaceae bacterium]|nr:hypothetical protein [Fimbriimonadaceae bacterium]